MRVQSSSRPPRAEKHIIIEKIREGALWPDAILILVKVGMTASEILESIGLKGYRLSFYSCFLADNVNVFDLLKEGDQLFAGKDPCLGENND